MRINPFSVMTGQVPVQVTAATGKTATEPKDELILSQPQDPNPVIKPLKFAAGTALTIGGATSAALGVLSPILAHPASLNTILENPSNLALAATVASVAALIGGASALVISRDAGEFLTKRGY